jgi:hypothetical protein
MATTAFGSETTQMIRSSRRGLLQMEHISPSVRFWQILQQWTVFFRLRDGVGKGLRVRVGRERI